MALSKSDRIDWFDAAASAGGMQLVHPLIGDATLEPDGFLRFRTAVLRVLCESGSIPATDDPDDFLRAYGTGDARIDVTPGSVVKICYANFMAYAELHREILALFHQIGLVDHITGVSLANLRVVSGSPGAAAIENRAYATTKLHIDVWAGEPSDILHLWIPLFGDFERTSMEIHAPPDSIFSDDWLRRLDDYDNANGLVTDAPLDISIGEGNALLFDGCCPHKTVRKGGGVRVSLDIKLRRTMIESGEQYASAYVGLGRLRDLFGD